MKPETVTLIMTGASGAQYGLLLLKELLAAGKKVYLLISRPAQIVIATETDLKLPSRAKDIQHFFNDYFTLEAGQLFVFEREQWMAPIASGSNVSDATVVCPCTTGTLASVAMGASRNLIERSVDVAIKERKPVILVIRETPFSPIHLEHMLKLSQIGVTIMPANPAFYHQPKTLEDMVAFMVARILDHLQISHQLMKPWGGDTHNV